MSYTLNKIERKYSEKTLITYYYQKVKKKDKKYKPIDIDGYRYKLDLETGEVDCYTREDINKSKNSSVIRSRIRLNEILDMNKFDWFLTLTFDPLRIDRTDENAVYKAYDKFIHNLSVQYPNLIYVAVPERHEDGCIHFHIVMGNILGSELGLVNSGKVLCHWVTRYKNKGKCSPDYFNKTKDEHILKDTDGQIVYTCSKFIYGLSDVTRIVNRAKCSTYVKKYIDKYFGQTEIFKKRYFYSQNCLRPLIYKEVLKIDLFTPKPMNKTEELINNAKFINAQSKHINEHNIAQFWVDNDTSDNIDKGMIPLQKDSEVDIEINRIFKEVQLKF